MERDQEIIIAGAGAAGFITAIALARHHRVRLIGPSDHFRNGRTVALFDASIHILKNLDLWPICADIASPLKKIRFVDDTQSFFNVPPIDLYADEIGLEAFGYNIENAALVDVLRDYINGHPNIIYCPSLITSYRFADGQVSISTDDGQSYKSQLVIGADGKHSPLRQAAGIHAHHWSYPQQAITALLTHEQPHNDTSIEFHTPYGPCTLVPMRDENGRHRSSLVWLMSKEMAEKRLAQNDQRLLGDIERHVHHIYGRMDFASPRGTFPMSGVRLDRLTAKNVALVADAGHFFPPIGAQGLNLGLRDIAALADCLRDESTIERALSTYNEARKADIALRTIGVDLLNRSLLFDNVFIDGARAMGLTALAKIGPLRRLVMRETVFPQSFQSAP
jgi:2-octaprenyl-6-methoxyphenol hydroxylase